MSASTVVFLHGVPETAAIWNTVRGQLGRESRALSLPGFGCARPAGFGATKDEYVGWILAELDAIGGPIDLVGHDWGAGFTYRLATTHGDRLRSWIADAGHVAHPDYVWHEFAKLWQTPGDGEAYFASQDAQTPEARAVGLQAFGISASDALEMARAADATMASCILDLYRSATPNPHHDWGPWEPTPAPGMILYPTEDPFGDRELSMKVAIDLGVRHHVIEGAGHFWPSQMPDAGVEALESFWASLDG